MHDTICLRYPLDTGTVCWYLHCCFSWMERHRLVFFLPKLILFSCLLILHHSLFGPFSERTLWTIILLYTFWSDVTFTRSSLSMWESLNSAVKKFQSRLIMNSRWLWNSHRYQRHKFLKSEVFSTADAMLLCWNTRKTGNNAVKMSQAFHHIARFESFTDLNLFKYAFNVILNWEMDALQFYLMELIFC